jgi:hypothetical protein
MNAASLFYRPQKEHSLVNGKLTFIPCQTETPSFLIFFQIEIEILNNDAI